MFVRVCEHARVHIRMCACARRCGCGCGCCFGGVDGCIPLTMLVNVYQSCCLLMFVCLPLSRHLPCCKTWWIKNLNLNKIFFIFTQCHTVLKGNKSEWAVVNVSNQTMRTLTGSFKTVIYDMMGWLIQPFERFCICNVTLRKGRC